MNEDNIILKKSYSFALRIVKLSEYLVKNRNEYVLSKQVLRSGTSIGANAEESIGSSSKKDFIAKLRVAYCEARETHYWIRLIKDSEYIDSKLADSLLSDCDELLKILGKIISTATKNN